MLEVLDVTCHRYYKSIFKPISFSLNTHEILQIVGANGSGKSSLIKAIIKIMPYTGSISHQCKQIFYTGHSRGVYMHLTLEENIKLLGLLYGVEINISQALDSFDLGKYKDVLASELSRGSLQKLRLCILPYLHLPLWLLDEPFVHLDHKSIDKLMMIIKQQAQTGSVIFTSHQCEHLADKTVSIQSC